MQEPSYQNRVQPRRLPEDAPNILIVPIDDAGPGLPDTFGGEVRTDALSRIRDEGIGFELANTTTPERAKIATAGIEARRRKPGERELSSALTTDGGTDE